MSSRSSFGFAVFVCIIISACASYFAPGYPEPPCGYRGVSCANGMCCPESSTCRTDGLCEHQFSVFPGTPADAGPDGSDASTDADAKAKP